MLHSNRESAFWAAAVAFFLTSSIASYDPWRRFANADYCMPIRPGVGHLRHPQNICRNGEGASSISFTLHSETVTWPYLFIYRLFHGPTLLIQEELEPQTLVSGDVLDVNPWVERRLARLFDAVQQIEQST